MSGKNTVLKTLAGCGCALVLIGLVGLVMLGWGAWEASKALKSYAEKNVDLSEIKRLQQEFEIPDVAHQQVVAALQRPLEARDVDTFIALNDWYYGHPASEKAARLVALDVSNPGDFLEVLSDTDAQRQVTELLKMFPTEVEKQGGWTRATDAAIRTAAMGTLAQAVGTATGEAPHSQKVADQLVAQADKVADRAWLDEQGAGGIADMLSVVPKSSLENWAKIPADKRQRALEAFQRQAKAALAARFNPVLNTCRTLGACP